MALTKTSIGAGASANAAAPAGLSKSGGTVGGWEPSVLWLLALIIAEVFAVAFLSRHLLK
jgi:hypothetical protein